MENKYKYGKSVISTNLKYNFVNKNPVYGKKRAKFYLELVLYCNNKRTERFDSTFKDISINEGIKWMFKKKVENRFVFHEGSNYYVIFNVYDLKDVERYLYKKTDTKIHTKRKKYLLKERINIYF